MRLFFPDQFSETHFAFEYANTVKVRCNQLFSVKYDKSRIFFKKRQKTNE